MTYAVVGCSECRNLWIIEDGDAETTTCPRCATHQPPSRRRTFATAEEHSVAAQKRTALLAHFADEDVDELAHYATLGDRADDPLVEDRTYLDGLGLEDELVDQLVDEPDDQDDGAGDTEESLTTEPGPGPDVGVEVADRPQLDAFAGDGAAEAGLRRVDPGGQVSITGLTRGRVPPQRDEWVQDLLEDLVPSTARLVRDLADVHDPAVLTDGIVERFAATVLADDVAELDRAPASAGSVEEARSYLDAIARYAVLWSNDEYRRGRGFQGDRAFERVQRTLRTTGTSEGQFNAGVDALRHSLVALHKERTAPKTLTFMLDGEAWTNADAETVKGTLSLFDVLAEAFDVRLLMSPGVRHRLRRLVGYALDADDDEAVPGWAERFESLTETEGSSRRTKHTEDDARGADVEAEAWAIVEDHSTQAGLLTVLAHLDPDGDRSVRALKRDDAIDYADASVDVYTSTLESLGLVDVDTSYRSNRLSLTRLGRAAQAFVATDGSVVPPGQSQLDGTSYGHPSASRKCSVMPQRSGPGGQHPEPEWWLADTGVPGQDASFVQWLGDATGPRELEPPEMHRRYLAGERVKGVNLVDDDILKWGQNENSAGPLGDGRVVYTSCFEETFMEIVQWGGPAPTLARLVSGLLDNKVLSKVLDIDTVGTQFQNLHDGVDSFENDLHDVVQRTHQIGWTSEEELDHYDNWRDRISSVRSTLLGKMGDLNNLDSGLRHDLLCDLQGLFCSASHLYYAAGIDVSAVIRMPDPTELRRDDQRYQDFLDFMRFTATKQAGYEDENGFHSIYRMLMEDRSEKLRSRSAYDVDEIEPEADLTVSWQIVGPGVSSMRDHIEEAIAKESSQVRESIAEGVESAAILEIPVIEANSHARTRGLIREIGRRKEFDSHHRDDIDRLARVLEAALATEEWDPSPYLVADVLQSLQSRDEEWDSLDVHALENGLATLPGECIFPELPPSQRRMLSALLAADGTLSRQELIAATSESSYDRHHEDLKSFWLVEETDDGQLAAHAEPWWASTNGAREPFHQDHPNPSYTAPSDPFGVLLLVEDDSSRAVVPPDMFRQIGATPHDYSLLDEMRLSHWKPVLRALCDDWHNRRRESYSDPSPVKIGRHPLGEQGATQSTLTAAAD